MWKKTLGFALLAFVLSLTLQGCYSHRRAYGYRDDNVPGYVSVRVQKSRGHGVFVRGYRSHGPSYRIRHYEGSRYDGRQFRKFKHKRHHKEHGRRHR